MPSLILLNSTMVQVWRNFSTIRALVRRPGRNGKVKTTLGMKALSPTSKEVALVMLADSVEAAVPLLTSTNSGKHSEYGKKLIKDKLDDGQFEMCDLTFRDLDIIKKSFCNVLEGIYHKRIEYPEVIGKKYEQRRDNSGHDGDQSTEQN